jgi:high-affinity Fe2+/Pb2+ permease
MKELENIIKYGEKLANDYAKTGKRKKNTVEYQKQNQHFMQGFMAAIAITDVSYYLLHWIYGRLQIR